MYYIGTEHTKTTEYDISFSVVGDKLEIEAMKNLLIQVQKPQGWSIQKGGGSILSSPVLYKDRIFFGCCNGKFYCLTKEGVKVWDFETDGPIISTPVISKDKIVFGSFDGKVYALDLDGKFLWKFDTGDKIAATPIVYKNRIFIGSRSGGFYCLSQEGDLIWKFQSTTPIGGTAIAEGDKIFIGSSDRLYCLSLKGKVLWEYETRNYIGSPEVYKNKVYFTSYNCFLYCVDFEGELVWKKDTKNPSPGYRNLTIVDGVVYFGVYDGNLYAVSAEDGRFLWKKESFVGARPLVKEGKIYFGDFDFHLLVLDTKGNLILKYLADGPIVNTPAIDQDLIFFGGWDCNFYCIDKECKLVWKFKTGDKPSPAIIDTYEALVTEHQPNEMEITIPLFYKKGSVPLSEGKNVYGIPFKGYIVGTKEYREKKRYLD